jgi:hypothetical protein
MINKTTASVDFTKLRINPLNAELNPICHLLALLRAHHILHVSRIRIKYNTLPVWSYWSPIVCFPGWRIGEFLTDVEGTREIKYQGQTKTSTAALRLTEGSVKARERKPRKKITWSSRLGAVRRAHLQFKNSQRMNGTGQLNECRRKRVQNED